MEEREPSYTVGGNVKLVQPLSKTVWRFLRKLKIELPYDPAISLLGIYPDKTIIQKIYEGFPSGAVVTNPLANAGDMGWSPGSGRPHMQRTKPVCHNY